MKYVEEYRDPEAARQYILKEDANGVDHAAVGRDPIAGVGRRHQDG